MPRTCLCGHGRIADNRSVSIFSRLDAIDRRILARGDRRYDTPPPLWIRLAAAPSAVIVFVFLQAIHGTGPAWWIVAAIAFAVWCLLVAAVVRWDRTHKIKRVDGIPDLSNRGY